MEFPYIFTLQFFLIFVACTHGWKGWPILVISFPLVVGFLLGLVANPQNIQAIVYIADFLDVVSICVLVYMCAKGRKITKVPTQVV